MNRLDNVKKAKLDNVKMFSMLMDNDFRERLILASRATKKNMKCYILEAAEEKIKNDEEAIRDHLFKYHGEI